MLTAAPSLAKRDDNVSPAPSSHLSSQLIPGQPLPARCRSALRFLGVDELWGQRRWSPALWTQHFGFALLEIHLDTLMSTSHLRHREPGTFTCRRLKLSCTAGRCLPLFARPQAGGGGSSMPSAAPVHSPAPKPSLGNKPGWELWGCPISKAQAGQAARGVTSPSNPKKGVMDQSPTLASFTPCRYLPIFINTLQPMATTGTETLCSPTSISKLPPLLHYLSRLL